MEQKEAQYLAGRSAEHIVKHLLPEILSETGVQPAHMAYLVVSSAMSSAYDRAEQVLHLSRNSEKWDADVVNRWAQVAAAELEEVLARFQAGDSIEQLEKEYSSVHMPCPKALVRKPQQVERHIEALLLLHGGEVSYYDYSRGNELLLVCLVNTLAWR